MSDQQGTSKVSPLRSSGTWDEAILWTLLAGGGIIRIFAAIPLLPNGLKDDAYIILRYAQNLAQGFGFVFNPGEKVLGSTTPLFTLILAAAGRLIGVSHLEGIAVAAGILFSIGILFYCERILTLAGLAPGVKWAYLVVLAFLPSFISNATSGMETSLVLFLMSLSLYVCMQNRMIFLAVVGVLLVLSRLDTGIWLLALGIHILLTKRGQSKRDLALPLAIFLAGVFSWLLFTKIHFGSVLPQSLVGKAVSHGAFKPPDWIYSLMFLSSFVPAQRFGMWGLAVIAVAFLALIPSTIQFWRQYKDLRPIVYFFPLYAAIFLSCRTPFFSWYSIPSKWAFYLLATYLIWWVFEKAAEIWPVPLKPELVMGLLAASMVLLGVHMVRGEFGTQQPNTPLAISNLIDQQVRPEGRVFLEHIGLIGYRTRRYIYDYMGLVTPETVRLRRQYGSNWVPKAARQYQADVVVLYGPDVLSVERTDDVDAIWFQNTYRHVKDYETAGFVISVYFLKGSPRVLSGPIRP